MPKTIGFIPADFTRSLDKLVPIKNNVKINKLREILEILMDKYSGNEV